MAAGTTVNIMTIAGDKNSNVEYLLLLLGVNQEEKNSLWGMYATQRQSGLFIGDFEDFLWNIWRISGGAEQQMRRLFNVTDDLP